MQAPFADPLFGLEQLSTPLPLVGREAELQLMRALLHTVASNLPMGARAMTISGDIGIGKSRFLAEIYQEARAQGFRVIQGYAYEAGRMFPYLPFIEALRPMLLSATPEQLRFYVGLTPTSPTTSHKSDLAPQESHANLLSLVGTPLVAALAQLFPTVAEMLHVVIEPEILSPDQKKFRLLDAIATLLERIAEEQPILLGIDNLQWADSASLELMLYLTVRLHSSRVALVGATRLPGTSPEFPSVETQDASVTSKASMIATKVIRDLMQQGRLLLLPLGPLEDNVVTSHIHALLPGTLSDSLVQSLIQRAEGNFFFLEELVRILTANRSLVRHKEVWQVQQAQQVQDSLPAKLPSSITAAVQERLSELSAACHHLLRIASLFGRAFPLSALIEVLEATEEGVHPCMNEAVQMGIIAQTSSKGQGRMVGDEDETLTYMFCQGIVYEVVRAEVPRQRSRFLHGKIGSVLEAGYGKLAPAHAAELAHHYALSDEKPLAFHWSLLAGKEAARQQAHREAIAHFLQALKIHETGNVSDAMFSSTDIYLAIGESWFKLGELEQAATAFQQALDNQNVAVEVSPRDHVPLVGAVDISPMDAVDIPPLQIAQAQRQLADVYRLQGKYELALAHLGAARTALEELPDESANDVVDKAKTGGWFPGRRFSTMPDRLLKQANRIEKILFLQAQATLDILLNDEQEAEAHLWQSHLLAAEIGDKGSQAFALHMVGWLRGWGEQIYEAIRLQEQAHELYVASGDPFRAALGDQGLGIIYQALGEMEQARLYTLRGFERARRYGVQRILGWLHWNSGVMALAQGDWSSSESHLQQALQEAEHHTDVRLKPVVIQAQAELAFRQGHWKQAEQLFVASITAAANTEWYPGTLALYGHFLAVTGRRAEARAQLDRAAAFPEPPGFGGDFYIPFLAEGYLHLDATEQAARYIERIVKLRGFLYYGNAVDRIQGVMATRAGEWEQAEQAFEEGLTLCRRTHNAPEEAAILYEQARAALIQNGSQAEKPHHTLEHVQHLCTQAGSIFGEYGMQRAVALVDTLQEGIRQLEWRDAGHAKSASTDATRYTRSKEKAGAGGYFLEIHLTKREQEVLRLVAEGHTDREVAGTLVISPRTVNRHLSNIFVKLDVPGRAAAVAYAIRQGMV